MSTGPGLSWAAVCQDRSQSREERVSDQVKSPPSHTSAGSRETDNTSRTLPRGVTAQSVLPSAKAGIEIPLHLAPDVGFGQAVFTELWERKPGAGSVKYGGK